MFKIKSFQRRILLSLVGVGLIPAMVVLLAGMLILREAVTGAGTAGPWGSLAESGQALLAAMEEARVDDPEVVEAAAAHQDALSESLRLSRMFTLLADRILTLLPLLGLVLALLIGTLSYWVARQLSRGFSRPIRDLVGWTQLIALEHPLPPRGPSDGRGVQEFTQLRDALRRMSEDLVEGRRQIVQAAKLRSWTEMARRVAHELKNPLTPMRMAAEAVTRMEGEEARESGKVLLEEISRLEDMAMAFAQFGRMPEGPPSEVDLVELLEGLIRQHQGSASVLRLEPSGDIPLVVAYYEALLRCFRNLLLNAMDASGPGGQVTIRLWREEDQVRIEIRDTGQGIPEDDLERIWNPDFSTKSRGTGLGLAMVQSTVAAHGGRVVGRNHPDGGAVFMVELPLAGPDSQSNRRSPSGLSG